MNRLHFYYSSMNSGKSLAILTRHYMLTEKGFKVIMMKPSVDTRTSGTISTRVGLEQECIVVDNDRLPSEYIFESSVEKPDFVLVDEAQFMSAEQIRDLANLVDNWGVEVYCYGLRIDWRGEFFTGSEELFKIADNLEPIENLCNYYKGAPAYFHIKLGGGTDSVEIGAEDMYESVSRKKWKEWSKK